MRTIKYLSPTSLAQWESNPNEFFCTRLSENRLDPMAQTAPMSIGSAVDARWKEYIVRNLLGPEAVAEGTQFHLESLFNEQVSEPHQRWAWPNSKYLMECYIDSGAMNDLMLELMAGSAWQFEFTLEKTLDFEYDGKTVSVPLLGKPDCYFVNKEGCGVVYDLKVNGYCSSTKKSPASGFIARRWKDGNTWVNKGYHKDAIPKTHKGVTINLAKPMEESDNKWAAQLATYAWMYGEKVGADFACGIEQFACGPPKNEPVPEVEIVSLRSIVSPQFQEELATRYARCWYHISQGYILHNMTYEENLVEIARLEEMLADPKERLMARYGH